LIKYLCNLDECSQQKLLKIEFFFQVWTILFYYVVARFIILTYFSNLKMLTLATYICIVHVWQPSELKMQKFKKTLGFPCPFVCVKLIHGVKRPQVMYLFRYRLELDSSKVHINCDKSWHLNFKFRSVKVQGDVSTCGKMKISWWGKCIYPKVYKRWQFCPAHPKLFKRGQYVT